MSNVIAVLRLFARCYICSFLYILLFFSVYIVIIIVLYKCCRFQPHILSLSLFSPYILSLILAVFSEKTIFVCLYRQRATHTHTQSKTHKQFSAFLNFIGRFRLCECVSVCVCGEACFVIVFSVDK